MGYEQSVSSQKKLIGLVLVVLLHVALIYAFVNGLAQDFVKKIVHDPLEVSVIDEVKLPPPPPPPPPPPQKEQPVTKVVTPPAYVPPTEVPVQSVSDANTITAVSNAVPPPVAATPSPVVAAPPPPPKHIPVRVKATLNTGCTAPKYPQESLDNEEEGQVIWSFLVDSDGHVAESKLVKSSGFSALDDAAKQAFSKCQFVAATVDGAPEKSWVQQPFEWKLK